MPKFTVEQINAELVALENSNFRALPYLGKQELKRRKAAQLNCGRPVKYQDERHKANREAARRYRSKMIE